jgi:hypothetical protein
MTDADGWERVSSLAELVELLDYLRVDANLPPSRAAIPLQLAGIQATNWLLTRAQRHRRDRTTTEKPRSKVW